MDRRPDAPPLGPGPAVSRKSDPSSGVSAARMRAVSVGLTAAALAAAVLSVVYGGGAGAGAGELAPARMMELSATCPPPCVPHVFSEQEESELKSMSSGQNAISGDEAVQQAMAAATDGLKHMREDAKASQPAPPPIMQMAAPPSGGFSQWDQMHGVSSPVTVSSSTTFTPARMQAPSRPDPSELNSAINVLLSKAQGANDGSQSAGRAADRSHARRDGRDEGESEEERSARGVIEDMTRPQLRALAHVMLRKLADRSDERRGTELTSMLRDGSRDHPSLRRVAREEHVEGGWHSRFESRSGRRGERSDR
eukprot:CAMPEP_0180386428 /NCGR_PEP_ID=MMETSP0989-20121125/29652_1 /TAXON_ID=697907 /ORGANISM="non described non described, Strain CCMP2293" /LENGTH=309 /DNA_ID=CAMNT_0022387127 /DNA_START=1 /DNA_END=927 /DNA_ORIENTATION=-